MNHSDPRYPVGPFVRPSSVTEQQRSDYLAIVEQLPANLQRLTEHLTPEAPEARYRPGGWTVRQVVHHLADSHLNAYVRFRLALTEESPVIKPYHENLWAELPDAKSEPIEVSLRLLEALHRRWSVLLRAMTADQFARTYRHPELGEMRLDTVLALYAWHSRHHLAHVERALQAGA